MFAKTKLKNASLILSYSNTGMISLEQILTIARDKLGEGYEVLYHEVDYKHSTMGRKDDKSKDVKEYLVIGRYELNV